MNRINPEASPDPLQNQESQPLRCSKPGILKKNVRGTNVNNVVMQHLGSLTKNIVKERKLEKENDFKNSDKENSISSESNNQDIKPKTVLKHKTTKFKNLGEKVRKMVRTGATMGEYINKRKKYVLYPKESKFLDAWEIISTLVLFYVAIFYPYNFAFAYELSPLFNYSQIFVDLIFVVDIILNFFTAYYNLEGEPIDSLKKIAIKYLKFWFWLDLLSIIPFDIFFPNVNTKYTSLIRLSRVNRLYKFVRITKLIKSVRVLRTSGFIGRVYEALTITPKIEKLIMYFFSVLLFCHFTSCLFYLLSTLHKYNWSLATNLENKTNFEKYAVCFYWVVQTVLTVGYGDIPLQNSTERIFAILLMLTGVIFFSFTVSAISSIILAVDNKEKLLEKNMMILNQIQRTYKLDEDMYEKVRTALKLNCLRIDEDIKNFLNQLPDSLSNEFYEAIYEETMKKMPIFNGQKKKVISAFASKVTFFQFVKSEEIYKASYLAKDIFFLIRGLVEISEPNGFFSFRVGQGEIFGDVEFLHGKQRFMSARAVKYTEVAAMDESSFEEFFNEQFPDLGNKLREVTEKKFEEVKQAIYLSMGKGGNIFDLKYRGEIYEEIWKNISKKNKTFVEEDPESDIAGRKNSISKDSNLIEEIEKRDLLEDLDKLETEIEKLKSFKNNN